MRTTLDEFGRATAAKDYQALCDEVFAPKLVDKLSQVGLPCELAMQRSFEDVENPRLTIGKIMVAKDEKSAKAEIRSSASGQAPSQDTVELVPVRGQGLADLLARADSGGIPAPRFGRPPSGAPGAGRRPCRDSPIPPQEHECESRRPCWRRVPWR